MQLFKANPNSSFKHNLLNYFILFFFSGVEIAGSFVFYFLYQNDKCSNSPLFSIQDWLLGNAIFFSILIFAALSIFGDKYQFFAIVYDSTIIVEMCFSITWSVIGSVILFRDSLDCFNSNINICIFTLYSLTFYWLNIILLTWVLKTKILKKNDS
jgi:hypothetical protein